MGLGCYHASEVLHFGLAAAAEADVSVRWPNKALTRQTFKVAAQERYVVVQGKDPVAE